MDEASAVAEPNKTTHIDSAREHKRTRNDCIAAVCDVRSGSGIKKVEGKIAAGNQQRGRKRGGIYQFPYNLLTTLTEV